MLKFCCNFKKKGSNDVNDIFDELKKQDEEIGLLTNQGDWWKRQSRKYKCCGKCTEESHNFWWNIICSMLVLFVAEASRGMVVPSLFLYIEELGGNAKILGFVVGGYSVGRLFGSIGLGWYYNRRGAKEALAIAMGVSILGNLLYSLGSITDLWMIFGARILVGFGSGTLSVVRAIISDVTTKEQRVRYMALSNAMQFIGFAIVPGIGSVFSLAEFSVLGIPINRYTSPGYVLALLDLATTIIVIIFIPGNAGVPPVEGNHSDTTEETGAPNWLIHTGVVLFIGLNFVTRGVLGLLETVGAAIFVKVWHSDSSDMVSDSSNMFLILGVLGLVTYLFVDHLRKAIHREYMLLAGSLFLTGAGSMFLLNYIPSSDHVPLWQFILGSVSIWSIGSPITQTLVLSTYSKMLGSRPKGTTMGWIGAAGSVGRIVLPTLSGVLGNQWSFIVSAALSVFAGGLVVVYQHLIKTRAYKWRVVDIQ